MFKSRFFKKSGKIAIMMVVAVMLFAAFVPGAFALNYNGTGSGSGNKAFNFHGYKYDTNHRDQLILYFDKKVASTDPQMVQEHGAECYVPQANDARTCIFFPETLNSNSYPAYNLSSGTYQLVVPGFDCEGTSPQNQYGGTTIQFTTVSSDLPGWLDSAPTLEDGTLHGGDPGSIYVQWSDITNIGLRNRIYRAIWRP